MVEKRTLIFVTLAIFVWASIATSLVGYHYLEQTRCQDQLSEKQQSLNELTENYEILTTKRNLLAEEYGKLYGDYTFYKYKGWWEGENSTFFINEFSKMLNNLRNNYTELLNAYRNLNETYTSLYNRTQSLKKLTTVTEEEFDELLNEWHTLFISLMLKEFDNSIGETIVLKVDLCIDYGNGTAHWHNDTDMPSGTTLFDLTSEVANTVNFTYYPDMAPGHIAINSINGRAEGWWLWSYWNEEKGEWVFGPVGCDAWILRSNGIYKWYCSPQ